MQARDIRRVTVAEYIALDRESDERWEYANGEAWATRGVRPEHTMVVRNVIVALTTKLRGGECTSLADGQKIATPRTRAYHYPDASILCGPARFDEADERAILNPTVLFEVLSPTTADYDRGGKLAHYRTIESLQDYVIVSWEPRMIEHHHRVGADQWLVTLIRSGALRLESVGVTVALDELWLDVDRVRAPEPSGDQSER